jgi:hypothetical protein
MSDIINEVVVGSREDCDLLADFFRKAGLVLLPCDDVLKGTKGYLCYFERQGNRVLRTPDERSLLEVDGKVEEVVENELIFSWRFADPIREVVVCEGENVVEIMKRCLSEPGWIRADDPKKLRAGFANYALSLCFYFPITEIRGMPDDIVKHFNDWRREHSDQSTSTK